MPRRKKRGHYHQGTYESKKGGSVNYRSGWEKSYCEYLDNDPTVVEFKYEYLMIHYVSNKKSGRVRKYIPDFLVTYIDGRQVIVEIKPLSRMTRSTNVKKFAAAKEWCAENDYQFQILTERELKEMHIL